MKIIVAGAGIGGLSAAIALSKAGFEVEVLERAGVLREIGAGLQLSPNAMKALDALGCAEAAEAVSSEPEALELRIGRTGAKVFSIPAGKAARKRYGAPYLHVHRADLVEVLRRAAEFAGARILLGARVAAYVREGEELRIGLDNGTITTADLLVGADGIRSTVRKQMLGDDHARFTGTVAWRILAPAAACPELPHSAVVWCGPRKHAVTYRIRKDELINFVGVIEEADWREESWDQTGDPAQLIQAFKGWDERVLKVMGRAQSCHRWALFDRDPLPRWSDKRVTLLGDACHPMPPFQAQGAAMALEDAVTLSKRLAAEGASDEALKRYEAQRKPRTTRVLASARSNMGVFHRSNPLTQTATYGPMRIADRLLPGFVRSRQDWIYGFDVRKG
ncbi:MAG TPA: FAD-dependent monooxygenase [Hyphomonadaceae bacterium]|nr:FAD-dependent monooxygenase [Hyphomonadaceae bacterium]